MTPIIFGADSSSWKRRGSCLLLLLLLLAAAANNCSYCQAFSVVVDLKKHTNNILHHSHSVRLYANSMEVYEQETVVEELYPSAELVTLEISKHRPLGCTVEESLAKVEGEENENDDLDNSDDSISNRFPPVFVSKVTEDGYAEQAGIKVGDVVVAVTGLFGDLEVVAGLGVDKIKSLVSSIPDDEPLTIKVARGTDVYEKHEEALVELCASPQTSDKDTDECVLNFLKSGYSIDDEDDEEEDDVDLDSIGELGDNDLVDAEDLVDNLQNIWASDLPMPKTTSGISDNPQDASVQKVKPWSSRSSPSGTFVRDPVTGEMRNIDPR